MRAFFDKMVDHFTLDPYISISCLPCESRLTQFLTVKSICHTPMGQANPGMLVL
jgi:hypothetical protein